MKNISYTLIFILVMSLLVGCQEKIQKSENKEQVEKPNILWIVCEDISPTLSFYGDSTAKTPNLDKLAKESVVYDNAFATVGVCAPCRSSIITSMYPTTIGTMHMRTGQDVQSWGNRSYKTKEELGRNDITGEPIRQYSAVIPAEVKCFTEYLRADGYYCTNNQKTDYQFAAPVTAWDENNRKAHWRNRPEGKPFFSVFNIDDTHESKLWKHENLPLTVNPDSVYVPPYFPDNAASKHMVARNYSNIELMDAKVGAILKQLKEDGLYDNTIVFFYSDHGGPLPREKREIYDSGLKTPFLIKDINSKTKGRTDRLISYVDLGATVLSLAGVKPPEYMEGKAFRGKYDAQKRDYVFGSSDRFDEYSDRIRSVRNKQFLYLRNFFPELPKYKDISYRKQIPMMSNFLKLEKEGKLNDVQQSWFETKTKEELYDCNNDPFNLNNLADDPKYAEVLGQMRTAFRDHYEGYADMGQMPETELIDIMWPGFKQPSTEDPNILYDNGKLAIECATEGASIAYIISDGPDKKFDFNSHWQLYTKPISVEKGKYIYTMAQRIGYKESGIITKKI
ncbi:sulfatase-like hydrolase/transferase [Gaetbulibacter aestuarii]|uniref:Sulfatase-like hydrolase/transferase n=1 Tax=Gaetbulibacter aestuarii TaxID=1502358 RepID=A0ABW7MWE3_9FLAO